MSEDQERTSVEITTGRTSLIRPYINEHPDSIPEADLVRSQKIVQFWVEPDKSIIILLDGGDVYRRKWVKGAWSSWSKLNWQRDLIRSLEEHDRQIGG